jgi:tetraacyldisaccharide 4'-kinase
LAYDRGWRRRTLLRVPVISIGNLTTGGSGKTPLVIETVELRRPAGRRPAVVSRGYGRRSDAVLALPPGSQVTAELAGDEPAMLSSRGIAVAVGGDRAAAARLALARLDCDLLVLDDGFQHRRLERQADLVVIDASLAPAALRMLPRGPLREPWAALGRADAVLITRCESEADLARCHELIERHAPRRPRFRTRHRVVGLHPVPGAASPPPGAAVVLLSGIARPERFETDVRGLGYRIEAHFAYHDHHFFSAAELEQATERARRCRAALVTTEKDWSRIPEPRRRMAALRSLEIRETLERPQDYLEFLSARIV